MNRRNYSRELERIIRNNAASRPRLLLQSCCGPCSSSVLEYLSSFFDITILWYNPNIFPESEYEKRGATLRELLKKTDMTGKIPVVSRPWNHEYYLSFVSGTEASPEGGARCSLCFRLRLEETAKIAKLGGFDYFCTTLTVSRHKNAVLINAIGEALSQKYGVPWLPCDFKKRGGEDRSQQLSKELGLYQQHYCGCEFSLYKDKTDNEA